MNARQAAVDGGDSDTHARREVIELSSDSDVEPSRKSLDVSAELVEHHSLSSDTACTVFHDDACIQDP